jgi:hypothetical protein
MSVPLQNSPVPVSLEKPVQHAPASYLSGITGLLSGYADPILGQYQKLNRYRGEVGNPGNVEALGRDVKSEWPSSSLMMLAIQASKVRGRRRRCWVEERRDRRERA